MTIAESDCPVCLRRAPSCRASSGGRWTRSVRYLRIVRVYRSGARCGIALPLLSVLDGLDVLAVARRLTDIDRDLVVGADAADDLDGLAVVVSQRDLGQVQLIVAHDRHIDFAVAEHQRV